MPSTESTNGEFFPFLLAVLTGLVIIFLLLTSHDLIHCLILVGIRVRITKSDINDGVSFAFP